MYKENFLKKLYKENIWFWCGLCTFTYTLK